MRALATCYLLLATRLATVRHSLFFVLTLTLVLLFVAACTPVTPPPPPPTDTPTPTPTPPPTPTLPPLPTATPTPASARLELWENLPPAQASALAADVATFEATYPNYVIEVQHYDDAQTLVTAIAEETVEFHLVLGDASLASTLQAQNILQPLDEQFPREFLESFASPALTGVTRDGQLWGLPDTVGLHLLLFYNRDLMAVPPANTEELYTVAESFTGDGRWGLAMNSYDPLWVVPWLWAYGGWLTDGDGEPTLNIPPMVNALTLYLGWHGRLTGVAPVATYVQARELFTGGQAAMLIDGEWAIGELSQVEYVNWGVAPLPVVGETEQPAAPLVAGRYWLVRRDLSPAEHEAALAFLSFVTTPQRQLDWTAQFGLLPTRREALKAPIILDDPLLEISAQQMQGGRGLLLGVDVNRIFDAMRGPLRAVLDGDMVPEEAARAMQAALEGPAR
jgi:arabinogalactan oligomer/maltooligosaccharide transport system substrate-binding protein